MASIHKFPTGPMERTNARMFILPDDESTAIDFAHVLARLEDIIIEKHRGATDPAQIIDLDLYRGTYRVARGA